MQLCYSKLDLGRYGRDGWCYLLLTSQQCRNLIHRVPPHIMLALGAALLSTTLGGVGPFEFMMLGLLHQLPTSEMLVSIVAFRIVCYAIPALCSPPALIRPFKSGACEFSLAALHLTKSNQAEVQIIAQNGGRILPTLDGLSAIWSTSQTITAVFNPISSSMDATLSALKTKQPQCLCAASLPLVHHVHVR
jgi:phosphatidylglycerol lysyltransferase